MGPRTLWKRAVALLAAAGLSVLLATGISADEHGDEAAVALKPAQLAAEIPEVYETIFPLQWGGGSLSLLIGKLTGRGCALNTLWVHDQDEWHPYNRYDVPSEFISNRQFTQRYEQDIPAGMLYATCADQPIAQHLQPTQIVASIPEEYDTMFELHWGGGSLYQLKGRLATMGCIVNNISLFDSGANKEYVYNQYNTNSTDRTNQQFLQQYEQFIPAGEFSADCFEVCTFWDHLGATGWCRPFEEIRKGYDGGALSSIKRSTCTDDFLPQVKEVLLPLLPMHPDVCVVRDFKQNTGTIGGFALTNNLAQPFILVNGSDPTNDEYLTRLALNAEVHELCHINQHWHWIQQLSRDNPYSSYTHHRKYFNNSEHGKEFIDLIGFTSINSSTGTTALPHNSVYRDIYSAEPIELSAELCKIYLIEKMGLESTYEYHIYDYANRNTSNGYIRVPRRKVDVNIYLTPEIREWLETYMILPEIAE